ncbi:MAG: lipoyl synthase [Desulfuromonadaceae bacterium]|nr:lipoyl synthase [Desulfuromonadaceae bacterium]MDD5104422.1 lipoyl synthase [Desulfuromonadaceae bacterium]
MSETAPAWLMEEVRATRKGDGPGRIQRTRKQLADLKISTVCESARCPNCGECFSNGTATFLILGDLCTRRCTFCAVRHGEALNPPDDNEPERLAQTVTKLGLSHVVITSVTRDDLPDGGAAHYARVVEVLRRTCPSVTIELLVPDFQGNEAALKKVLTSKPDVLAHNMETVPRLYETVRSGARYEGSLELLRNSKRLAPDTITKSGLMLGLGESRDEIESVLTGLAAVKCDVLTIGQYLAPSIGHAPVARYVSRDEFEQWRGRALGAGFRQVISGPLVRSSYKAAHFFGKLS